MSARSGAAARRRRLVLAGLLGFAGLLALVYTADVALGRDRVPRGTRVAGVDLGGRSVAAAKRLLAQRLATRAAEGVTVRAGGRAVVLVPAGSGLRLDVAATVERARSQALNPFTRLASFVTTHDVAPVAAVDRTALRARIAAFAALVDQSARQGGIRFDGTTPVQVQPRPGRVVDVDATLRRVVAAYLHARTVEAPIVVDPVRTTPAEVQRALAEIARPAVAAPVRLTAPGHVVTMTPRQVAAVLRLDADKTGHIAPVIDRTALETVVSQALRAVEAPAKDAAFSIGDDGAIAIGPSTTGTAVDRAALADALVPVLGQPAPRTVALSVVVSQPHVSTERARTLGIREQVSTFTTHHPCCRPRVHNIHTIADIVDGAVVLPGETFSLNGFVGERDTARGFVKAPMIYEGKFVPAVGGGVSQFATTMFNAVFFGGFEDVHHKAHSYYISRYPAGREATVSSPAPDLRWRNDSPYGVLVTTSYTSTSVTVSFWSTKRYDVESVSGPRTRFRAFATRYDPSPTCERSSGEPGFDIDVFRVFRVHGKEVRRQKFHTRYLPEPRFVCGPPPAP